MSQFISVPKTAAINLLNSGGQSNLGVDKGPVSLVEAGLLDQLNKLGWKVKFDGQQYFEDAKVMDDPPIGKLKNPRLVSGVNKSVAKTVGDHMKNRELVVTLGGDHSLTIGTISGTMSVHPDACVFFIDAHADINTPESTKSGNIYGMPLSFLLGIGSKIPEFSWVEPILKAERLVYIGLRDMNATEKQIIRDNKIKAFSIRDIDKHGITKVVEMALDHVNPNRNLPIHMSFDIDALDPSVAPSTDVPAIGGLTFREGQYICETISETGLLVAFDLVQINPFIGNDNSVKQTVTVGCSLVRSALGLVARSKL